MGSLAGSFPLVEINAPQRAENDDAGHVQAPTGKAKLSHLGLAHGIEEELHVPASAGQRQNK